MSKMTSITDKPTSNGDGDGDGDQCMPSASSVSLRLGCASSKCCNPALLSCVLSQI